MKIFKGINFTRIFNIFKSISSKCKFHWEDIYVSSRVLARYFSSLCIRFKQLFLNNTQTIIVCVIIVSISFKLPSFQYFFMLILSAVILIMTFPITENYVLVQTKLTRLILEVLDSLYILNYFEKLYIDYFSQENSVFMKKTICIYSGTLLYVMISKYLFINKNQLDSFSLDYMFLSILLFLSLIFVYIRILLNTAILLHNLSWSILKTEELPQDSSKSLSDNKPVPKTYNIFNFSRTFHYNTEESAKNALRYKRVGLVVGICTLCVAGYAGYQQRLQTISAQEQVRAQQINNDEMIRQNDLEEVSQGLMSKEEYIRKYSKIK